MSFLFLFPVEAGVKLRPLSLKISQLNANGKGKMKAGLCLFDLAAGSRGR